MANHHTFTRRGFVRALFALPALWVLAACGLRTGGSAPEIVPQQPDGDPAPAGDAPGSAPTDAGQVAPDSAPRAEVAEALPPTPACGDDDDPTPPQTEGPYFTPSSPERASLVEPGMAGTPLVVSGHVLSTRCRPIVGALLDFWHCDDAGVYDNVGYRLRGHQYTDADGRFRLDTIMPGVYTGRTRHIHVKVQAPDQPVLTTQLYFPGEPQNARDGIYDPALEMTLADEDPGKAGAFDFVLDVPAS